MKSEERIGHLLVRYGQDGGGVKVKEEIEEEML